MTSRIRPEIIFSMKIGALFLLTALGVGCTGKELAIKNADTLLSYQVTKRLPLTSSQKNELSGDLAKFLNESKPMAQEILPVVDEIKLEAPEKTEKNYKKLETFYLRLAHDFSKLMSRYMAKLNDEQQKEFFQTAKDENQQIIKKDKADRLEDIEERMEKFFGNINTSQKRILSDYSDYFMEQALKRVERRKELQQRFGQIYAQDVSKATREDLFLEAFMNYQDQGTKSNKNLEIIKRVLPTITPSQREHFRRRMQEIKEILSYYLQVNY